MTKNILIIGATSAIAQATARIYAQQQARIFLLGRNEQATRLVAEDLRVRGASGVEYDFTPLSETGDHKQMIDTAMDFLQRLDVVLIAYGMLGNQQEEEQDFNLALQTLNVNCLSIFSLLMLLGNICQKQKSGSIAVISSVAGDRGRQSNYVYGAAKGALSLYLQGMRNRLHPYGVHVLTIKPGFVISPMTAEFKKGLLWVKPDTIARGIIKAVNKRRDVAYLPAYWRWIMWVIKSIPEFIFKRLKL